MSEASFRGNKEDQRACPSQFCVAALPFACTVALPSSAGRLDRGTAQRNGCS